MSLLANLFPQKKVVPVIPVQVIPAAVQPGQRPPNQFFVRRK